MSYPYIQPPSSTEMIEVFARWISGLFRVKVVIIIDDLSGNHHTVEIAHPDRHNSPEPHGN